MSLAHSTQPGGADGLRFPDGFLWGVATASYRIGGGFARQPFFQLWSGEMLRR